MTVRIQQAAAQLTRIRGVGCAVGVLVHLRTPIQYRCFPTCHLQNITPEFAPIVS